MGKLFNARSWLTVSDAARHLAIVFDEDVTEADVLRLALDSALTISVNFINPVQVKKVLPRSDPDNLLESTRGSLESLRGIFDLPLLGVVASVLEHKYQMLTGGPSVDPDEFFGLIVSTLDGERYELQRWNDAPEGSRKAWAERNFVSDPSLPSDSILVVRTEALREFEKSLSGGRRSPEKGLSTTERNTLLTIIAALCDYSAIKIDDWGTARQIAKLTEEIGATVSDDTVRRWLKLIPDALATRMK